MLKPGSAWLESALPLLVPPSPQPVLLLAVQPQHFSELERMQLEELQDWLGLERFHFAQGEQG